MATVKYSLEDFIHDMETCLKRARTSSEFSTKGRPTWSGLYATPEAIPEEYRRPIGHGPRAKHGTYKLHQSESGLSVSSVIWGPGDHVGPTTTTPGA